MLIQDAESLSIGPDLKDIVGLRDNKKIAYGIIRGNVKSIGVPITSAYGPSIMGAIQVLKLSEHRVARGFAGFWTEQRKEIHRAINEVPFVLANGPYTVEVTDALNAHILDLDVVYDHYEPSSLSFFDHIFSFFSGIRQRGVQTTEEMLREGSFLTAVGELELDENTLRIQPSNQGPLLLTSASKKVLIEKFREEKFSSL